LSEGRIAELMRRAPLAGVAEAEERSLRVVLAAYREREPSPLPPRRPRLALALAACLGLLVLLLSPAGAKVRHWVGDAVDGEEDAAPALTRLPGGGTLLVDSAAGPWVVQPDGSRRLLGAYGEASWSPRGLFVAAVAGRTLTAVEPDGDPHWSLSRPEAIADPRWSPSGFRIAYRSGRSLRVVQGDGAGDKLLASAVSPLPPAWRPGEAHVLAYLTATGRLRAVDTDTGRVLFRTERIARSPLTVDWSADGRRFLVLTRTSLAIYGHGGRRLGDIARPVGARFADAEFEPAGRRIAVLWRYRRGEPVRRSEVLIARLGPHQRLLFSAPGTIGDITWAPSGDRLLVPWAEADQWVFVAIDRTERTRAVGNVSRQFSPGARRADFPSVSGWCCPP
jgi:WD40-like Beta Propeller Repeat